MTLYYAVIWLYVYSQVMKKVRMVNDYGSNLKYSLITGNGYLFQICIVLKCFQLKFFVKKIKMS